MFMRIICNHLNICILSYQKIGLDFIDNKFRKYFTLCTRSVNSVISVQVMLLETYNIDKSSFEHHIYDVKP
jgi:hypothetical protein